MSDMENGMQKTGPLGGEARRYGDSHWEGEAERAKGYELSGKIMLSAIVILFVVIVLMAGLHLYARWYLLRARRRHLRRRRRTNLVFYVDPNNPSAAPVSSRGLDPAVLKSLPVFSYSPKEEGEEEEEEEALECAVCLSEFEEHEKGRRLPKCNHCFHIECIDMWFHSHSTCPLCRYPVVDHDTPVRIFENPTHHAPQPQQQQEVVITVTEPGSSSGLGSSDHQEGGEFRTASLKARRRAVELVGVSIEVPRRNTSFGRSEEGFGSPSFKSPGGRMRSLRRILSRDIRAALSPSPSSAPGCSGSVSHELDLERAQTPRPRASE